MTTIDLPAEAESYLRTSYAGTNPADFGTYNGYILSLIANALPDPPYIPEVGDVVHVYEADGCLHTLEDAPEHVAAVTDEFVVTLYPAQPEKSRPSVYAYRIDAHRFEKVEQ